MDQNAIADLVVQRLQSLLLRSGGHQESLNLRAHPFHRGAKILEDVSRDALSFDEEAEQQVLGADVVVPHAPRFIEGDLDDLLDAGCRDDLLDDDPLVTTEHGLDRLANNPDLDAEVVENLGGEPFTFAEQAQEQVLRADITVVRSLRFFLGERQNLLSALGKSFERIHGNPRRQG